MKLFYNHDNSIGYRTVTNEQKAVIPLEEARKIWLESLEDDEILEDWDMAFGTLARLDFNLDDVQEYYKRSSRVAHALFSLND